MLVFVWRLVAVRLLWAFALERKKQELVRSCLNEVDSELNLYVGGSNLFFLAILI